MAASNNELKREGVRLVVAAVAGFFAGALFFTGQCGFWPTGAGDRIAAIGVIVNVLFGAATVTTAFIAYRLGSRDANDRAESKGNTSDIAAGLMFSSVVGLQYVSNRIAEHAAKATLVGGEAARAKRFRTLANVLRRFASEIDARNVAEFAVCHRELALTLSYALGRVRLLPDLAEKEAERLEGGTSGTEYQRRKIAELARVFEALASEFVSHCETTFARTIKVSGNADGSVASIA